MCRPAWFVLGIVLLAALAWTLRAARLAERPMHCDEANQAVRAGRLFETGQYAYDPHEHHDPSLYWLTLPSLWLSGARDLAHSDVFAYRIVPVAFGVGLILLLAAVADGLGRPAALIAGLLAAISPALVYYARDYIQETLLVFFTFVTLVCGWRWVQSRALGWALAAGACLGMLHATKETWILAGFAMLGGLIFTGVWTLVLHDAPAAIVPQAKPSPGAASPGRTRNRPLLVWHWFLAALTAVLLAAAWYSSFGRHLSGPLDSLLAYATYFRRGTQAGIHTHAWYYYGQLLLANRPARGFFWSEGLIVGLAAVGAGFALWPRGLPDATRPFSRFLACYTLLLTEAYSAVSYKTPWCLLSFLHAMTLLAGVGAWALWGWLRWRPLQVLAAAGLLAAAAQLGWQCYQLNFRFQSDLRNPYVYAASSTDVVKLSDCIHRLAAASPAGKPFSVHVISAENYWPLPWYLRDMDARQVLYWEDVAAWTAAAGPRPRPAVIILSTEIQSAVDALIPDGYNKQMIYGLRPSFLVAVYVRNDVWSTIQPSTHSNSHALLLLPLRLSVFASLR